MSKFDEWARRSDTKAKLASAKKNAWAQFTKQFPNADKDKFRSQQMKKALGFVEGFPFQLSPLKTKTALPIPAVEFIESVPSIAKIFNQNRIYATPDEFFVANFRNIFQQVRLTHKGSAETKKWLSSPNMQYWPQQLNFAVFCATQCCGISREIFDSGLSVSPQTGRFTSITCISQ